MSDADARLTQPSFTAGEISPELYGRKDLARYQVGARRVLNCFVHPHGGVSNRAGLKFAAEVKDSSKNNRLTTFEAADDEAFLLVWGDLNVRPMYQGAWLNNGGSPYEVVTPYPHTDLRRIYMEQSNDVATVVHPLFPVRELSRYDILDWRMELVSFSSAVPPPAGLTAVVTEGYTGYGGDKLKTFKQYVVSAVSETGEESLPSIEVQSGATVVLGYDQNFITVSWIPQGSGYIGSATPGGTSGGNGETQFSRQVSIPNGAIVTHIGFHSNVAMPTGARVKIGQRTSTNNMTIVVDQAFVHPGGGWFDVPLSSPYTVPGSGAFFTGSYQTVACRQVEGAVESYKASNAGLGASGGWTEASTGSLTTATRAKIQGPTSNIVVDSYNVYKKENGAFGYIGNTPDPFFVDTNFLPSFANGPQDGRNPFEGVDNYPQVVTFVQQRRVFGATLNSPQTIWETQAGNYRNMSVSSPVKDDDAIEFTLASKKKQDIYHIVPLEKGMIVFTRSGEWRVTGRDGDVITPSSILPMPQTSYGSTRELKPLVTSGDILFVPRTGRKVMATGYSLEADGYVASDLTLLSNHLFKGRKIISWDVAEDPDGIVWCVMDDGKALSLTYLKEHDVWGWGRTETRGRFLDVAVVPEATRDVPYFLVERRIGGVKKQYIEYLESRAFLDVRDAFFVDSGLSLNNPVAISAIAGGANITVTSAAHGLVDGDTIELAGVRFYNDDEVLQGTLDGRWVVGNVTTDTFRIKYEYDDDSIGVVAGDDVVPAFTWSYYDPIGVFRKGFVNVTGLAHLNGRTVVALVDGNVATDLVVVDGAVTPDGEKHFRMHVGLSYQSVVETLDLLNPQGDDTGLTKSQPTCYVRVDRTRGVKVGQTEAEAVEEYSRSIEDYFDPAAMQSGLYEVNIWDDWANDLPLCFVQDYPLPMTILGVTKEIIYGG